MMTEIEMLKADIDNISKAQSFGHLSGGQLTSTVVLYLAELNRWKDSPSGSPFSKVELAKIRIADVFLNAFNLPTK